MTPKLKKRASLRKTKRKSLEKKATKLLLLTVLKGSTRFVLLFKRTFLFWFLANLAFLYALKYIPNGWTNSWCIPWLVVYYIFWCTFTRSILQHQPYFSIIRIFNGLIPSSKIMFINISIYLIVVVMPYIPLFMGFGDKYLTFFEQYMYVLQSHDSILGKTIFYMFMLLLSPYTMSRPYLAWISSLVGKSRSIIEAYEKTHGNYWKFVLCLAIISAPFLLSFYVDTLWGLNTLIFVFATLSIYFNVVFINIYKVFYKRSAKAKPSY